MEAAQRIFLGRSDEDWEYYNFLLLNRQDEFALSAKTLVTVVDPTDPNSRRVRDHPYMKDDGADVGGVAQAHYLPIYDHVSVPTDLDTYADKFGSVDNSSSVCQCPCVDCIISLQDLERSTGQRLL